WALPFRAGRIEEMLYDRALFGVEDFQNMQQDVLSHPARIFRAMLAGWAVSRNRLTPREWDVLEAMRAWDCTMTAGSMEAAVYETWIGLLPRHVFQGSIASRVNLMTLFDALVRRDREQLLMTTLKETVASLTRRL